MNKLHIYLKSKINNMRCTEHNQQAEVKIFGDKISFNCCCDPFRKKISGLIEKTTREFVAQEIKNVFK